MAERTDQSDSDAKQQKRLGQLVSRTNGSRHNLLTVVDGHGTQREPSDARENLVGRLRPHVRLTRGVGRVDEGRIAVPSERTLSCTPRRSCFVSRAENQRRTTA